MTKQEREYFLERINKAEDLVIDAMEILEELSEQGYAFETDCYDLTDTAQQEITSERYTSEKILETDEE